MRNPTDVPTTAIRWGASRATTARMQGTGRHFQQCENTGTGLAGTNTLQSGSHQYAVIAVQRHHICHCSQGNQVSKSTQVRFFAIGEPIPRTQLGT